MVPGRTDASCFTRWTFGVAPRLVKGAWGNDEDEKLISAVEQLRRCGEAFHFGQVAELMGNSRHRKACRTRYDRLVKRGKAVGLRKHRSARGHISSFHG